VVVANLWVGVGASFGGVGRSRWCGDDGFVSGLILMEFSGLVSQT
jgi:hypothetical protein